MRLGLPKFPQPPSSDAAGERSPPRPVDVSSTGTTSRPGSNNIPTFRGSKPHKLQKTWKYATEEDGADNDTKSSYSPTVEELMEQLDRELAEEDQRFQTANFPYAGNVSSLAATSPVLDKPPTGKRRRDSPGDQVSGTAPSNAKRHQPSLPSAEPAGGEINSSALSSSTMALAAEAPESVPPLLKEVENLITKTSKLWPLKHQKKQAGDTIRTKLSTLDAKDHMGRLCTLYKRLSDQKYGRDQTVEEKNNVLTAWSPSLTPIDLATSGSAIKVKLQDQIEIWFKDEMFKKSFDSICGSVSCPRRKDINHKKVSQGKYNSPLFHRIFKHHKEYKDEQDYKNEILKTVRDMDEAIKAAIGNCKYPLANAETAITTIMSFPLS